MNLKLDPMVAFSNPESAISPKRSEDFAEWYQQIVKQADMAENAPVRGCMTIKPWGYAIWEAMQKELDARIKATGHLNAYFPLLIPLSFLQQEATHVEGFAKECAVVTHHRLEERNGKLVPAAPLEEPLIIRPTSETIIGEAFSRWIQSYRDLPLLINQWANVMRWEMRPRVFLRTTEFLWQEGHTAHATSEEALAETRTMLQVYQDFMEGMLAIPTIPGEKSPGERFPGAVNTFTLESMMQDGKALQSCTSHYLGQNFAKASGIYFSNKQEQRELAYTTSWGITTRLIGALIMCHGDDDGLRLPPRLTPYHVVILPVIPKPALEADVMQAVDRLAAELRTLSYRGTSLNVFVDRREKRGGEKNWEWVKKGVPLRMEIGPRDLEQGSVMMYRRDQAPKERHSIRQGMLGQWIPQTLDEIQDQYYRQACSYRERLTHTDLSTFDELAAFFSSREGFVRAKWCGDPTTEGLLEPLKISIRCIPLEQSGSTGRCILTGRPATLDVLLAKSY